MGSLEHRLTINDFNKPSPTPTPDARDEGEYIASHPLGVRPNGNAFVLDSSTSVPDLRPHLGLFSQLPDELIAYFLEFLDLKGTLSLGGSCKAFYAFTTVDETWRRFFEENPPSDFSWHGSWRSTFLNLPYSLRKSGISCRGLCSDHIYRPFFCAHVPLTRFAQNIPARNLIPRLQGMTEVEYATKWSATPFILTDEVPKWPVYGMWSTEYLLQSFAEVKFRAEALEWTLEKYVGYMRNTADESPLYLFDKSFRASMSLSSTSAADTPAGFWPPTCFGEDLFTHLGAQRPDSTWLILGPARSGSTVHVDPNGTNAWNAVLTGSKYWLMFPPPASSSLSNPGGRQTPPGVILSPDASEITAPVSLPEYLLSFHALARAFPGAREGICRAGELLHVPAGWFHLVLNLSESLAVTGNFVHRSRLGQVLRFMRDAPGQVSGFSDDVEDAHGLFVERLRERRPGLVEEEEVVAATGQRAKSQRTGKKRTWEEVKRGNEGSGGFSFGFGEGEDDEEVELPERPKRARWEAVAKSEDGGGFSFGFSGGDDDDGDDDVL